MYLFSTLLSGIIFGLGLAISGMADPAKVQNFLDLFGTWDPSLAFVMGGAIAVTMPGYMLIRKMRRRPLFSPDFRFPTRSDVDTPLVVGAGTFGIGWGLGGFCPGPALAAVPLAAPGTIVFVVAMLAGMALSNFAKSKEVQSASA